MRKMEKEGGWRSVGVRRDKTGLQEVSGQGSWGWPGGKRGEQGGGGGGSAGHSCDSGDSCLANGLAGLQFGAHFGAVQDDQPNRPGVLFYRCWFHS